jgi:hypothetical protein
MENIPILAPAAVLVLWSLVVLLWMTATRFPAFAKAGLKVSDAAPGSRYVGIRVAHSIWQGTVNVISVRIALFTASTLCLWVLAINAIRATMF